MIRMIRSPEIPSPVLHPHSLDPIGALILRGFYLHEIPFTRYICLVPFLHLHINKSSVYAILSKNS